MNCKTVLALKQVGDSLFESVKKTVQHCHDNSNVCVSLIFSLPFLFAVPWSLQLQHVNFNCCLLSLSVFSPSLRISVCLSFVEIVGIRPVTEPRGVWGVRTPTI